MKNEILGFLWCLLGFLFVSCQRDVEPNEFQDMVSSLNKVEYLNIKGDGVKGNDHAELERWQIFLLNLSRVESPDKKIALVGYLKVATSEAEDKIFSVYSDGYLQYEGRWYKCKVGGFAF